MATPKEIAEWYAILAENDNGFTYLFTEGEAHGQPPVWLEGIPERYPTPRDDLSEFKVNQPKPKIQKIDMSVCIESGIDCEFGRKGDPTIGKLKHIKNRSIHTFPFAMQNDKHKDGWKECRVRENHWHYFDGVMCPIPEGLVIEVRGSWATEKLYKYHSIDWSQVTAFKIESVVEGWEY